MKDFIESFKYILHLFIYLVDGFFSVCHSLGIPFHTSSWYIDNVLLYQITLCHTSHFQNITTGYCCWCYCLLVFQVTCKQIYELRTNRSRNNLIIFGVEIERTENASFFCLWEREGEGGDDNKQQNNTAIPVK